jgi:hypothetical protein
MRGSTRYVPTLNSCSLTGDCAYCIQLFRRIAGTQERGRSVHACMHESVLKSLSETKTCSTSLLLDALSSWTDLNYSIDKQSVEAIVRLVSGTSSGGGTATGSGLAQLSDAAGTVGVADGSGSGLFTSTSGSSGSIDTVFGAAEGSSAGGGTGTQAENVGITLGGLGTLTFLGTTTSSGGGGFGAGFSPVQFNTVVTEVPGTPIPFTTTSFGGSKKGGTTTTTGGGVTPPTFTTTIVPVSTGPLVASVMATELSALIVRQQER